MTEIKKINYNQTSESNKYNNINIKPINVEEIDLTVDTIDSIIKETTINKNAECFNALKNDIVFSQYLKYLDNSDYEQLQLSLQPIHYIYNQLQTNLYKLDDDTTEKIYKLNNIYKNSKYEEMGKSTSFLNDNITNFLKENESSIEQINISIKNDVANAGPGTREGVVAAAKALTNELLKYNVRLPYISGIKNQNYGKYSGYGVDPNWGNYGVWFSDLYDMNYFQNGLDCSGFIDWAIHNGGYKYNQYSSSYYHDKIGKAYNASDYIAKEGDLLWRQGHVGLVVDVINNKYIVAEEHGGGYGLILSEYDTKKPGEFTDVVDMSSFYENNNNKDLKYYNE